MKKIIFITFLLCNFLIYKSASSQHFRLKMDLTIKEKSDSIQALYKGQLFYDINLGQLIYQIKFPTTETWVITDSFIHVIINHKLVRKTTLITPSASNIFKLMITNQLNDFGLKKAPYKIYQTKSEAGLNIFRYSPTKNISKSGNIDLAYRKKLLESVVMYKPLSKNIVMKQFFKKYMTFEQLFIPTEYYQIVTIEKKQMIKKYAFSFVVIDELDATNYFIDLKKIQKH